MEGEDTTTLWLDIDDTFNLDLPVHFNEYMPWYIGSKLMVRS